MKDLLRRSYDKVVCPPEELWEKAGAQMREVQAADGSIVDRPFFDLEISNPDSYKKPLDVDDLLDHQGRKIGFTALHQVDVNGVDYLLRAYVPDERDITYTTAPPFLTGIDTYLSERAEAIAIRTHQPYLVMSSPHAGQRLPFMFEPLRVPKTAWDARLFSLAMMAQTQQAVFSEVTALYGLNPSQEAHGDSKQANTTPGQYLYTDMYGAAITNFKNSARCFLDRLEPSEFVEGLLWTAESAATGGISMIRRRREGKKDAISLNPNFWTSQFTGTLRSLVLGEGRELIDSAPAGIKGLDIVHGRDRAKSEDAWRNHPNVETLTIEEAFHNAFMGRTAIAQSISLVKEYIDPLLEKTPA